MESSPIYTIIITLYWECTRKQEKYIVSYNIAENSKRIKRNEEKVYVCVCLDAGWWLVSTLND
jgi:hypothetical protein